jgi:AcrR family transcriptional regulator
VNDTRSYNSPSRELGKSETRTAIMNAVVKVILEQGIHAFTIQNVAEAAGISHRTVYRHFESREALLEGLQEAIQRQADDVGLAIPQDVATAVEMAGPLFEEFYRMGDAMHASVIAATALGYQSQQQRGSLDYVYRLLAKRFVHLSEVELRDAAAVFRCIVNRYTWYVLAINHALPATESARAVSWAVRVLMEELDRRDRAHSKRSPERQTKPSETKAKTSKAERGKARSRSHSTKTKDTR